MVTVVFTGGEAPPLALCRTWLQSSQRVIAADGGLALLRTLGQKADLWIGDGDSLAGGPESWRECYAEARILDKDKDDSDTEAAVRAATVNNTEVWIVGGAGGRMDHWMANLRLAAQNKAVTRWLTAQEEAWTMDEGRVLNLPAGTVSVFPLGKGPWSMVSQGLQWPLNGVDFEAWHSLSNTADASASLTARAGRFLVLRPFLQEPTT